MLSNEIPLPDDPELRQLVLQSGLGSSRGITFGHGIVLKPGAYDRHLIAHELAFLVAYIPEVVFPPYYPNGPLEQEAERLANTRVPQSGLTPRR
jgi:hypothetical protein